MTSTDDASTVLDERRPGGYGCCDVDEPIAELRTLGLIDPTPEEHQ